MNKAFCLSLVVAAFICSVPGWAAPMTTQSAKSPVAEESHAVPAPPATTVSPQTTTTQQENDATKETKEDTAPVLPDKETAVWQVVASNSRYTVAYDTQSMQYDEKKGVLTLWNRWTDRTTGQKTFLLSQYDVRLRVYSDQFQFIYDGLGNCTRSEKVRDTSWYPLAPGTLGMALCDALKSYLISH